MNNFQTKQQQLEERLLNFSIEILKICKSMKISAINRSVIDQLIRSSTSIGANYTEANNASSKSDFRNKIFIAKKEASETRYSLKILSEIESEINLTGLIDECSQVIMIMQKIVTTLKAAK